MTGFALLAYIDDPTVEGDYPFSVVATMEDFPSAFVESSAVAHITSPCVIESFVPGDEIEDTIKYGIGSISSMPIPFTFPYFPCFGQLRPEYEILVDNSADLPPWISLDD